MYVYQSCWTYARCSANKKHQRRRHLKSWIAHFYNFWFYRSHFVTIRYKAKTRKGPVETPEAEFNKSPTVPSSGPAEEVHWEKPNCICRFRDDSFTKKTACWLLRVLRCGIFHCTRWQSAHYRTPTRIRMSFTGYVCLYQCSGRAECVSHWNQCKFQGKNLFKSIWKILQ